MDNESTSPGDAGVVVVGSGPAGAAATLLLVRAGNNVTLLEAGTSRSALGLTARIGGMTVARLHRPLQSRSDDVQVVGDPATVLFEDVAPGGLTNHWSCAVPRFSPDDFADGQRAGDAWTWPLDYGDLAPWYDYVEPLLSIAGSATGAPQLPAGKIHDARTLDPSWQGIADAAQRTGQAILPVPYVYGGRSTLTLSGSVFNSFVRLVKPLRRSGLLKIRYGSHVTQLEWSAAKRRVEAVLVRDTATGATERIACRAVVLAAGAINTTKILLQSTSADFPDGLGNTHGVLGRYLHDHPLGKLVVEIDRPMSFQPAVYVTRAPLDRTKPLYAAACLQWSGVHRFMRSVLRGQPGRHRALGFSVFGTMAPLPHNQVALDHARRGADGLPGLSLDIRYPPESAEALEGARDRLMALLEGAGLKPRISLWLIDPGGYGNPLCRLVPDARFPRVRHARSVEPAACRAECRGR